VLALERYTLRLASMKSWLAIYDKKLSMAASDQEKRRKSALQACAALRRTSPRRRAGSGSLQDILKTDPRRLAGASAPSALYQSTEKWQDLAKIIRAPAALTASDALRLADLKFSLGEVCRSTSDDPKAAGRAFQESLSLDPNHTGARAALEAYLGVQEAPDGRAVAALEPIYEALHESNVLFEVQRIKLETREGLRRQGALQLRIGVLEADGWSARGGLRSLRRRILGDPSSNDARGRSGSQLAESMGKWTRWWRSTANAQAISSSIRRRRTRDLAGHRPVAYDEKLNQSDMREREMKILASIGQKDPRPKQQIAHRGSARAGTRAPAVGRHSWSR